MPELVSTCQSAFIKGCCIHDIFVAVQMAVRRLHQSNSPALLLKLDISKAFDSVSWEFLIKLLAYRRFPRRWVAWIAMLPHTSSTRILVNQALSEPIDHRRVLRQGDPLSPLLFVLVMDCLSSLLFVTESEGLLLPVGSPPIRHRTSLYADDAMLFLNPSGRDSVVAASILQLFGNATDLAINLSKSKLYNIRCHEQLCCKRLRLSTARQMFSLASILTCRSPPPV